MQTAIDALAEAFPFDEMRSGRAKCRSADNSFEPYPVDTSVALAGLLDRFEREQQPAAISFRQIVPWLKVGERASHYLHPYPAKLLPHIAHFFLANRSLVGVDEVGYENITVHGFRSTFRDWAGEETDFEHQTIEMALAHSIPSKPERAYRRGRALRKRVELMTAWAQYCGQPEPVTPTKLEDAGNPEESIY